MYKVTVCGSFHRHLNIIRENINEFLVNNCEILSPKDVNIVDEIGDFLFVASDPYRSIKLVENRHLYAIAASDLIWLVAPDGYIGQSASLEMGYAFAKGKPIYSERNPPDLTLAEYIKIARNPKAALDDFARIQISNEKLFQNVLLDPVEGTKEAHALVDRIAFLLSKPGVLAPSLLEKEVAILTKKIFALYKIKSIK